jgi:ABC-type amino acid transport system permease subunit
LLRTLVNIYSSFIRGTPALVQILVFYYALAPLTGINIGPFTAGIMAVGFNSGAYIAEILRGGLSRIPKGQREAAESLGLPRIKIWFKVILPQVFHSVIPLLVNEFTMVIKITPLLSTITVVELTRASQMLYNETFRPVEVLTLAAVIYFIICFSISQLGEHLQRRSQKFRL